MDGHVVRVGVHLNRGRLPPVFADVVGEVEHLWFLRFDDVALAINDRDYAAQIAAHLSMLLSNRGAGDEAARLTAHTLTRAARASVSLVRGDPIEAAGLARAAVDLVPADMVNLRGAALVGLAKAQITTGDRVGARAALSEAVGQYERKGNRVAAEHARRLWPDIELE